MHDHAEHLGDQRDWMSGDQLRRQLNGTLDHLHLALEAGRLGTWEYYFADESFAHDRLCAQLFGADPDGPPLSIEDCLAAVHEDDQPVLRRQVTAALASGSSYEEVFRVRHPDGSLRWTLERARASFDDQGWPERLDGVVMDVTDREDAALRVIETLDSVRDGYLELDDQWRFTHVNRSAEETIGRPRDELYGQRVFDVLPELVGTEFEQHHRNVADSGEPTVFEALYEPWQRWYEVRVSPTEHGVVVFFVDITDRVNHRFEQQRRLEAERAARQAAEAARARLTHIAAHDELTGLLSRREFERRLDERLRTVTDDLVVLFLDLDDFKIVNDGLGHAIGDRVLSDIAGRLREHVADEMLTCRFGGDEFLLVTEGNLPAALQLSEQLRDLLSLPYTVCDRTVSISTSVGLASGASGEDAATVIRNADAALFAAKRAGKGRAAVYDEPLHQQAVERLDLEHGLRAARSREELLLHYQPIFSIDGGQRCGLEALLRWQHPQRGLLNAGAFIDVAEKSGLIVPIGSWVLNEVGRTLADQRQLTTELGPVWINVAPEQLDSDTFVDRVAFTHEAYALPRGALGVELTERTLVRDPPTVARQLARLHELGVPIAVDDFGTGYSSMSALQHHPIDVLKIDRSFVVQLGSTSGRAVVGAIIQLAHALGASASAEGVEHLEQWEALARLGCDTAAGYLLARPRALDEDVPDVTEPR